MLFRSELYEIKFVQGNKDMFMLGRKYPYFYELQLELFKYSQEIINTGIPEVDIIGDESQYNIPLTLGTGTGTYLYKEIVYQSPDGTLANATSQAIASSWNSPTKTLNITNIAGTFLDANIVHGATSNAQYTLVSYDSIESSQAYVPYDNKVIQKDRKSTRLNSSHIPLSRMPSSA